MASMAWPPILPMPRPAPIAARPAPIPAPIALIPASHKTNDNIMIIF